MKYQLYVWNNVFCDYYCGMAVAVARNKEEAIKAIADESAKWSGEKWKEWERKHVEKELTGVEPDVYPLNKAVGFHVTGGG